MATRKRLARFAAAVTAVIAGFGLLLVPGGAQADTADVIIIPLTACDESKTVSIGPITGRWATAHWTVRCYPDSKTTTVTGWVEDKKSDGYCARVKADINSKWYYSPRACPKGDVKDFTLRGGYDTDPQVFLYREK